MRHIVILWTTNMTHYAVIDNECNALRCDGLRKLCLNLQQISRVAVIWTTNGTHCGTMDNNHDMLCCYWQQMPRIEVRCTKKATHWSFELAHWTTKVDAFWQNAKQVWRVAVIWTTNRTHCGSNIVTQYSPNHKYCEALQSYGQQRRCFVVKSTTNITRCGQMDNKCDVLWSHG